MNIIIKQVTDNEARKISKWIYKEPYSIYSLDGNNNCIRELLNGDYYSAVDMKNSIVGYYCFGRSAQVPIGHKYGVYNNKSIMDIGLGINPEFCGQGLGKEFLKIGLDFAREEFNVKEFRLTVASFNKRAIKVYERVGFRKVYSFMRISHINAIEFDVMILNE
ncbi:MULTISPECIES: GNAT family protein [Clostridium]|uniref:GNAT family N-acetyltransferase n=1 Tax=Clostridium TaxID=1485 RepID=UPI001896FA07|nr:MULTISPECIES: GNAT family protein [Clostridium]MDI9215812.1 GNAT family N-acetyltransferase [Clostridium tertium]